MTDFADRPPPLPGSTTTPPRPDPPAGRGAASRIGWSLKLGTYAGIGVYLHWTFALLIAWIFFSQLGTGAGAARATATVIFVLALFFCVVLHEYGHALMARRFGIRTRDITLLPIGGLARLERMPDKPGQEFLVAIAGPAVNVAIAAILFVTLLFFGGIETVFDVPDRAQAVMSRLLWINLFLAAFNLLPAFPMDGGRVLRAALAVRLGRARATAIAATIGQGMAILFGIAGFFANPFLIFIAIFVFLGAQAEAQLVQTETALDGLRVTDGMMTRYRTLAATDLISRAVDELLAGSQQDFPVVQDGAVLGLLRRNDLVRALADGRRDRPVTEAMTTGCGTIAADELLTRALDRMRNETCTTLPVLRDGRLVGLLTTENISDVVVINAAERTALGR